MYTYLHIEELVQEGRELMWTATAFEGRDAPPETRDLYNTWLARARQVLSGRADPPSGWLDAHAPIPGRELARRADEVLAILQRVKGVSTEDYTPMVTGEPGAAGEEATR